MKPELLDYACVLARMYALCVGKHTQRAFEPNPFRQDLDMELAEIHKWLDKHSCLEGQVVNRVRELIPSTNWDGKMRKVIEEVSDAASRASSETDWEALNAKILALRSSDWKVRLDLEDLLG